MKPTYVFLNVCLTLAASLKLMPHANAEIPKQPKHELQAAASHVLVGTVKRTYEKQEKRGEFMYTYSVAELAVERVEKGTDIVVNDRVFVRFWRKQWMGNGIPPPSHYGHWDIPAMGHAVEVYVKGDRTTGFDVLSPNGFFNVTKRPATEK